MPLPCADTLLLFCFSVTMKVSNRVINSEWGTEVTAQPLRALANLPEEARLPEPISEPKAALPGTPITEDLVPSSGLGRYCNCMYLMQT